MMFKRLPNVGDRCLMLGLLRSLKILLKKTRACFRIFP